MNSLKLPAILMTLVFLSLSLEAETYPLRIQALAGLPTGLGTSVEYAFPTAGWPVHPAIEAHGGMVPRVSFNTGSSSLSVPVTVQGYADVGASLVLYFRETLDGPYAAAGYDRTWMKFSTDVAYSTYVNSVPYSVTTDFMYQSAQLRLGWRWMFGRCTIAVDGGYGIAFFDGRLPVSVSSGALSVSDSTVLRWNGSDSFSHGFIVRLCAGVAL